MTDRELAHDA